MAFFKKAMNYLGLGPDDAYDDYDLPSRSRRPARRPRRPTAPSRWTAAPCAPCRRPVAAACPGHAAHAGPESETAVGHGPGPRPARRCGPCRPGSAPPRPYTVRPTRFDHAQEVADNFKEGLPVIVNLQDVEQGPAAPASSTSAPASATAWTARWTRSPPACTCSRRRMCRCRPRIAGGCPSSFPRTERRPAADLAASLASGRHEVSALPGGARVRDRLVRTRDPVLVSPAAWQCLRSHQRIPGARDRSGSRTGPSGPAPDRRVRPVAHHRVPRARRSSCAT